MEKERRTVECPLCGCRHCPVTNTREKEVTFKGKKRINVRRYRVCRYCGWNFTTVEVHESSAHIGFPDGFQPDIKMPPKPPVIKKKRNPFLPPEQ